MLGRFQSVLVAVAVVTAAMSARAESTDNNKLIRTLQSSEDFRVRTQAALSLGGSRSKEAVPALCQALQDDNSTVRAAAAAALGRLHLGGGDCLEQQQKAEKNASVRAALKKAIVQLRTEPEPEFTPRTRYYVAIGKIVDNTGRTGADVSAMVLKAMQDAADTNGTITVAPTSETATQATKRLAAHKGVKGLYLMPKIGAPQYADRSVKLKVEVAYLTYPGKALLGMMGIPLSATGIRGKDQDVEDQLIVAAAERAIEKIMSFGAQVP